jgi:carbamoyltransferase
VKVLGISPAHDASVCLYENGNIVSFYKEERLSRKKRDGFPILSAQKALEGINHVDIVIYCGVIQDDFAVNNFATILDKFIKYDMLIDFSYTHHLQHASLAFYNSGFNNAAVIVVDRNGSVFENSAREAETIYNASYPANFEEVYKNFWTLNNSVHENISKIKGDGGCEYDAKSLLGIVKVYETATVLIGEHILENGKTMGLSAYGNKNAHSPNFFINNTNIPNNFYFGLNESYESINYEMENLKTKKINRNNYQVYADYAWQIQKQTQEAVAYLIKKAVNRTGQKNIVISGGYGLNVVANKYYLDTFPELNFYFEPLSDDTGNSIGGAMFFYRNQTKDMRINPIKNTFFHGKKYPIDENIGNKVDVSDIAEMIMSNKSVAIFHGLAEAGPRALGHRSILFNPMNKDAKKIINKIKKREWYRPFAASVLEEDANQYFDMKKSISPFMTISFPALEKTKSLLPGIVHVDGTCRVQTVGKEIPVFYQLLQEIKLISGHGVVLNTSFNLAGEPLVETPLDAIKTLQNSELDVLWFPDIGRAILKEQHEK